MNEDRPDAAIVPDPRNLIAQYLLLYAMSGDPSELDDMVDYDYQAAHLAVLLRSDRMQILNDAVFEEFTAKDVAADRQLLVQHGQPMLFGKDRNHGIRMRPGTLALEVVTLGEHDISESDVLVHDQTNRLMAQMLAGLKPPEFPVGLGVLYDDPAPSYEVELGLLHARDQVKGTLDSLLRGSQTWTWRVRTGASSPHDAGSG